MNEGRMELDSGPWAWRITELEGGSRAYVANHPAGEADPDPDTAGATQTILLLEHPDNPDRWMATDLPPGAAGEDVSGDELRTLARNPDRRQFMDPDGKVWLVERIDPPEAVRQGQGVDRSARHVRVTSEGGPERIVSLPEGRPLGTLNREELLSSIRDQD